MTGVHTGKYRVIWRLSVMPRAQYVFDISFRAETERGHLVESNLPRNARLLEFGSDYFDFVLSELLEVHDPFEDVIVECKSTSTDWKTNIALCSVRLEPVIDKTRHASPIYHWMDDDCSVDLLPHGRAGRQVLMTKEGRGRLRLRRLRNLRSSPGASYRPWEPWTTFRCSYMERISENVIPPAI
ncbi:hypothetical protein GGI07_002000 [Coemansia sp. Benny D115]|nr:hypothetical protein GGI07_002000 [Coemansia sp. Benny D115]